MAKAYESRQGEGPWRMTFVKGRLVGIEIWVKPSQEGLPAAYFQCIQAYKPSRLTRIQRYFQQRWM